MFKLTLVIVAFIGSVLGLVTRGFLMGSGLLLAAKLFGVL